MAARIVVESQNRPIENAQVLVLLPKETWKSYQTDKEGVITPNLHSETVPFTVFAAAEGYEGTVKEGWIPADGDAKIELKAYPGGGSCIFSERSGGIPGLAGELQADLNPGAGGTQTPIEVQTNNLAINGKNPVDTFIDFGQVIEVSDSDDVTLSVSIRTIVGKSVLLDYWSEHPESSGAEVAGAIN